MMISRRFLTLALGICLSLVAGHNLGCSKSGSDDEDEEDADNGPPPPSPYTLSVNLDVGGGENLEKNEGQALTDPDSEYGLVAGTHHFQAAVIVLIVNANLAAHISVPVALLRRVLDEKPQKSGASTWLYSFDWQQGSRTWTANLTGTVLSSTATSWSMRVTRVPADENGCCTDFEFFSGQISSTGGGTWTVFDPRTTAVPTKLYSVTYDYKSATERTLQFTAELEKSPSERFGKGSTVTYMVLGEVITMTVRDIADTGVRVIEWNAVSGAGSHVDPDGSKTCWGTKQEGFENVNCEQGG